MQFTENSEARETDIVPTQSMSDIQLVGGLQTKLANDLILYVTLTLFIVGTIGNLLTLVVMQTKEYRKSPSSVVLGSLAVVDTAVLMTSLLTIGLSGVPELNITAHNVASCKILTYLTSVFMHLSPALVVTMTIERLISIFAPFHAKTLCTKYRMMIAVGIVTLLCALVNVFILVYVTKIPGGYNGCGVSAEYEYLYYSVWPWVDFTVSTFLPSLVIVSGNILILRQVLGSSKDAGVQTRAHRSMSITLILISVCFVILTWPSCVLHILHSTPLFIKPTPTAELLITVTMLMFISNSSVNFFLYCLSGSRFRRGLAEVFTCDKKASTTSTSEPPPPTTLVTFSTGVN
ncbi:hypothetical protein CAPTEDRAFT_211420 [Capitella teleta]|uniref:G-protein coupled receptors family 1 profile domain-containing protein n=1 Tax=Capitella teleta TaxID=283909 RepID=R7TU88_CAPTE|nr:hypothetical protein CAPTEDRAFT_211420 [Capitella teleta]|eukprot:ELT97234.1 hypothetical protein CAPTEDRAFT_211420 [Capitella teleta]